MPTILLIRHGQASFGSDDYDRLSATGVQQARIAADALATRRLHPARILTGSLRRQCETAAPAAATFELDPEVDPRWNEYSMDEIIAAHHDSASAPVTQGAQFTSAVFQDILEGALARWMAAGDHSPAPESWPAFRAHVTDALHDLAGTLGAGSTALVFTSAGVIATVAAQLLDGPTQQLLRLNRVAVNTGISKIAAGRRGLSLISFNDHAHLEPSGLITYR